MEPGIASRLYPYFILPLITLLLLQVNPFFRVGHPGLQIGCIQSYETSEQNFDGILDKFLG